MAPLGGLPDGAYTVADQMLLARALQGADLHGDGIRGSVEVTAGASPFLADTDGDGLTDAEEIDPPAGTPETNPGLRDSDGDGLHDGEEVTPGADGLVTDPTVADEDGDGVEDGKDAQPAQAIVYYHGDHLGSTTVVTNQQGGVVERALYQPYGEAAGGGSPPEFGFTGQRFEADLGIYDYGARFYDPALGRFLSADPVVPDPMNPQDLNRYSYVRNNPLNRIDPTGKFSVGGFFGGVGDFFGSVGSSIQRGFGAVSRPFTNAFSGARNAFRNLTTPFADAPNIVPATENTRVPGSQGLAELASANDQSEGRQVAAGESVLFSFPEEVRKVIDSGNERKARAENRRTISRLRQEAASKGTVRGRPINGRDVFAFEILRFREDSATGLRAFKGASVALALVERGAPRPNFPDRPMLFSADTKVEVKQPVPIYCGSCIDIPVPGITQDLIRDLIREFGRPPEAQ